MILVGVGREDDSSSHGEYCAVMLTLQTARVYSGVWWFGGWWLVGSPSVVGDSGCDGPVGQGGRQHCKTVRSASSSSPSSPQHRLAKTGCIVHRASSDIIPSRITITVPEHLPLARASHPIPSSILHPLPASTLLPPGHGRAVIAPHSLAHLRQHGDRYVPALPSSPAPAPSCPVLLCLSTNASQCASASAATRALASPASSRPWSKMSS